MDGESFDRVTRAFATGQSRRSVVKRLLGMGGAAIAVGAANDAEAARRGFTPPVAPPTPPTPICPLPNLPTPCGCIDPATTQCCGTGACANGQCTPSGHCCVGSDVVCGDTCVGADKCCDGHVCTAGQCSAIGSCCADDETVCGPACCPNGSSECCDNACCYGTCYGEELCCPTPRAYCAVTGECCGSGASCCVDDGCCDGACFPNISGFDLCCAAPGQVCLDSNEDFFCFTTESACCTSADCPSGGPCQVATCVQGVCGLTNVADGGACDDGNECTSGDTCQSGVCTGGSAIVCPVTNECFTSSCDVALGCSETYNGDGSPCSNGTCMDGACCTQTCGARVCGGDVCGSSCGECVAGTVCSSDGLACTDVNPTPACIGYSYCSNFQFCGGDQGACTATVEGGGYCGAVYQSIPVGAQCDSTSDCPAGSVCADVGCLVSSVGYYCAQIPLIS
jgi:hypothetical protein